MDEQKAQRKYPDLSAETANVMKLFSKSNEIRDIKLYFENEVKHYKKKKATYSKLSIAANTTEIIIGATGAATGTTLTFTGVGMSIGIPIASGSVVVSTIVSKVINKIISIKEQQYSKMYLLSTQMLNEFISLLAEFSKDGKIDDKEYTKLYTKYQTYKSNKKELKTKFEKDINDILIPVGTPQKTSFLGEK